MKAVIYQFWEGNLTSGNEAGVKLMKEYADRIGVEHVFELNPKWPTDAKIKRQNLGRYNPHYGAFKPLFDVSYDHYDYILFCDTDVVPRKTYEHIFGEFMQMSMDSQCEIGICEEHMQPELRSKYSFGGISASADLKWHDLIKKTYGTEMAKDNKGRHRVFNSGCVMYSARARKKAQEVFVDFHSYCSLMANNMPSFYQGDQNYLNAMLPKFDWAIMDYKWNSQVFFQPGTSGEFRPISDYTNDETNFVHVQLRGADNYNMNRLKKVIGYDQRRTRSL